MPSRLATLVRKFNLVKRNLERQAFLMSLPPVPYLVKKVRWPEGIDDETPPSPEIWQRYLDGEFEEVDRPGYEEHNVLHSLAARERRVEPKIYTFAIDEDGIDP